MLIPQPVNRTKTKVESIITNLDIKCHLI
ncbi:hypothetical protein [Neobacillus niacini]